MFEGDWMGREAPLLLKHWQVGGQIRTQKGGGRFLLEACGRGAETWGRLLASTPSCLYCVAGARSLRWCYKELYFGLFQLESSLNPFRLSPLPTVLPVCSQGGLSEARVTSSCPPPLHPDRVLVLLFAACSPARRRAKSTQHILTKSVRKISLSLSLFCCWFFFYF